MILVSYKEFVEYLKSEGIDSGQPIINEVPCIVEYKRDSIIKAKIEVVNKNAYKWNEKYGLTNFQESKNKYWIRGKERIC